MNQRVKFSTLRWMGNTSDVDKNRRKECGRKGGWELVSKASREEIAQEDRLDGVAAWENATVEEQEERRLIGRTAFDNLYFDDRERVVTSGMDAYSNLDED